MTESKQSSVNFVTFEDVANRFKGKSVAIVGSSPSCLKNENGFIDSHDVVVRINNFKTKGFEHRVGKRTDVFYSFFGSSVRKDRDDLSRQGVTLCMCKCPNSKPIQSEWHERNRRLTGIDFSYIYKNRNHWWFCDTYIPTTDRFVEMFSLLGNHIPTSGFSCVYEFLLMDCDVYVTGFDFFSSKLHNVNEKWRPGRQDDPIGHSSERERNWFKENKHKMRLDGTLRDLLV